MNIELLVSAAVSVVTEVIDCSSTRVDGKKRRTVRLQSDDEGGDEGEARAAPGAGDEGAGDAAAAPAVDADSSDDDVAPDMKTYVLH